MYQRGIASVDKAAHSCLLLNFAVALRMLKHPEDIAGRLRLNAASSTGSVAVVFCPAVPVLVVRSMDWGGLKLLRPDRRKLATAIKDNVRSPSLMHAEFFVVVESVERRCDV